MVVPLSISPLALAQEGIPPHRRHASHRRFLTIWREHGVLHISDSDKKDLLGLISKLPQNSRKIWQEALNHPHEFRNSPFVPKPGWPSFGDVEFLEQLDLLSPPVRLVAVSDDDYQLLECGDDPSVRRGGLEICSYNCVDAAETLDDLKKLATTPIEKGDSVDELWQTRFGPLARGAKTVIVVDRYVSSTLAAVDAQLKKLANYLAHDCRRLTLKVFAAEPMDIPKFRRRLQKIAGDLKGGIYDWQVNWVPDELFSDEAHDRYIRFDNRLCTLGSGIEFLRDTTVRRRCEFSCRRVNDQDRAFEARAHALSRQNSSFWSLRR